MKKGLFLSTLIALFAFGAANAQEAVYYSEERAAATTSVSADSLQPELLQLKPAVKKTSFSLQAGSMFGRSAWGNSFATYLAPQVNYDLTNRLQISGGVMFINSQNTFAGRESGFGNGQQTNTVLFASGSYKVNDRLVLSGMAYHDMNNMINKDPNNRFRAQDMNGMAIHAEFKISEHFSIGAGFSNTNGGMYGQPFGGSMFGPQYGNQMGRAW